MLSIKTSSHIRNMRNVKSFRSGHTFTGVSMSHADKEIMSRETERLLQRNERRRWLIYQWNKFPIQRHIFHDRSCHLLRQLIYQWNTFPIHRHVLDID